MEYYYGWGFFLWPILFFFLIFGVFAWWPTRWRGRREGYYDSPRFDGDLWSYPYTAAYLRNRGRYRGRGPRNYRRSDERINEDVNDRLLIHEDVDASEITVLVEGGVVTLMGGVSSRSEKRLAEWLADSVPGVVDVKNQLVVRKGRERAEAA